MFSKLFTLIVIALAMQNIESVCVTTTTTTEAPTTTEPPVIMWHICPRTMKNWLRQNRSASFECQGGPSNNLCRNNSMCNPDGGLTKACCQQKTGCNACEGNPSTCIFN